METRYIGAQDHVLVLKDKGLRADLNVFEVNVYSLNNMYNF